RGDAFQIGASIDLSAHVCDCDVTGHLGFDALFILSPFSFIVDIDASVSVSFHGHKFASVHLNATVAGPAPWHAKGTASISLLFVSVGIHFDHTWGLPAPAILAALDPWVDALEKALGLPNSWRSLLPEGVFQVVQFAPQPEGEAVVLLDPAGALSLAQKAVPLTQAIDHYAGVDLVAPVRFDIAAPSVNGSAVDANDWQPEQ